MSFNENQPDTRYSSTLWGSAEEFDGVFTSCMTHVFFRMFAALLVTTIAAFAVVNSYTLQDMIFSGGFAFYGLLIAEIVLVIGISAGINRLSVSMANILFFLYALLNGLTLSAIFWAYDLGVIYSAFGTSALMFAIMAGYGLMTRRDLTSIGNLCFMGLIGVILASVVNLFMRNDMIDALICYVGVFVFIGLTAYDSQRIRNMLAEASESNQEEAVRKITVIGALTLYLDFINLFLKILRIMGRRR